MNRDNTSHSPLLSEKLIGEAWDESDMIVKDVVNVLIAFCVVLENCVSAACSNKGARRARKSTPIRPIDMAKCLVSKN